MLFRFHEPLASSRYCFYVTTNQFGAARVKFLGPELITDADPTGDQLSDARQWWRQFVDDETLEALWAQEDQFAALRRTRDRLFTIRRIAAQVIRTDLYLTGPPFPGPK